MQSPGVGSQRGGKTFHSITDHNNNRYASDSTRRAAEESASSRIFAIKLFIVPSPTSGVNKINFTNIIKLEEENGQHGAPFSWSGDAVAVATGGAPEHVCRWYTTCVGRPFEIRWAFLWQPPLNGMWRPVEHLIKNPFNSP